MLTFDGEWIQKNGKNCRMGWHDETENAAEGTAYNNPQQCPLQILPPLVNHKPRTPRCYFQVCSRAESWNYKCIMLTALQRIKPMLLESV